MSVALWSCQPEKAAEYKGGPTADPLLQQLNQQVAGRADWPDAYFERAGYYYDNGSFEQAIADLQQALRIDSTHLNSLHRLADVYLDYYQSKKAIATLERAVALYPEDIHTLLKKSEFHLILKQYEESMRSIDQILRIEPHNAEAYFMFGQNFVEQGDTARAINSYQTAVENDPELLDAWIKLGQLQAAQGNNRIAEKYFDSGIAISPEYVLVRHAKADYLAAQNRLAEAIEVYRDIITIDADYEDAYFNTGLIYLDMDSIPQAYERFDICLEVSPLHIRAYYYRGLAAEFLGRRAQAKADYEQALTLAPDYEDPQAGLHRLQLAVQE